ncbi:MAG: 2-amino-4-hydroxy-6-hydroxymethyldihydropteridine diphosphokinase [Muribaculaceae bacterium]|nr:2-amino-4-hydroxy-6-hydroxymethyldihydropteridine diphosphokinase [Muribaculaceae bacterium]
MHYFLNLGSNLGNPKLNLSRALRALEKRFGYFETSKIMESAPWGFLSPNRFANIAVMIVSDKSPEEVLTICQEIEKELNKSPHRDTKGGYKDRELDIDIMAADDAVIETESLRIPHPHLAERKFFLAPMAELAPLWRHPVSGKTCEQMLAELPEDREDSTEA